MKEKPEVYLLHFNKPYWKNCRHYLGYAFYGAEKRLEKHRGGNGSLLVAYALRQGCEFVLARKWEFEDYREARRFERKRKRSKHYGELCPICQGDKL